MLLTVCSSTPLRIAASLRRRFLVSSSSSTGSAFTALRFRPETSSASRCCRSAGVSVQSDESESLADVVPRPNCRAFNFVGSSATMVRFALSANTNRGKKETHNRGDPLLSVGRASIPPARVSWVALPLRRFFVDGPLVPRILSRRICLRGSSRGRLRGAVADRHRHPSPNPSLE